jgi:carbon-monoxide dehydrogenase medium subunit
VIPASFEYARAASLEEALKLLGDSDGGSRPIAGGQSLLPLMKLRLARPERLIDIGRLAELRRVCSLPDGRIAIGSLTTWTGLLEDRRVMAYGLLGDAIPRIGDVAVRNRGTIGGSLAHADPAADIVGPLLALEAEVVVRSSSAQRTLAIADLIVGPFTTSLGPGELITELQLPAPRDAFGSAYVSIDHPASGYPIAGAAAVVGRDGSGSANGSAGWAACFVALTGVGERPYRAASVEQRVRSGSAFGEAVRGVADGQRVLSDPYADREYRAAMAEVVSRRALELAAKRAG